ncbi:hypothetical protein ABZ397_16715 [Streptomyces sp. NPDC005876]
MGAAAVLAGAREHLAGTVTRTLVTGVRPHAHVAHDHLTGDLVPGGGG